MRGEFNGLKTLILKENPCTFYIHCFAHQLQLILVAVAENHVEVASFFDIISMIMNYVGGSCKCRDTLRVKEVERVGIPVVHMATVVPISLTIGANRIIPGIGIPYPLGNPKLGPERDKKVRRGLVERALKALQTEVDGQTVFE